MTSIPPLTGHPLPRGAGETLDVLSYPITGLTGDMAALVGAQRLSTIVCIAGCRLERVGATTR